MQAGLDARDRKLLIATAALTVALAAGSALLAPATRGEGSTFPSSYSSTSSGALAAYLLLVDLKYDVHRWEESPARLSEVPRGAILILAEPSEAPSNPERRALRQFVEGGGRILFCGPALKTFFPEAQIIPVVRPGVQPFAARIPSYATEGARSIALEPEASWRTSGAAELTLYGEDAKAVVVAWKIGNGEVLWWASAGPLTNGSIRQAQNLRLFLNAASTENSRTSPVYWDEYFHGQRASLWNYVEKTPVVWGIFQLGILMCAILFSFSRRSGPIATAVVQSRLSPLEFVDTLGGLYQGAGAASIPVSVAYRRLRLRLTQRLGMPLLTADAALAEATSRRLGWDEKEFHSRLAEAAVAEHLEKLRPAEALNMVQKLTGYLTQLQPQKTSPGERK
jgi:hypothetical protein